MKSVLTLGLAFILALSALSLNTVIDNMDRSGEVQNLLKEREAAEKRSDAAKVRELNKKLDKIVKDNEEFLESTKAFECLQW